MARVLVLTTFTSSRGKDETVAMAHTAQNGKSVL